MIQVQEAKSGGSTKRRGAPMTSRGDLFIGIFTNPAGTQTEALAGSGARPRHGIMAVAER